MHGEIEKFFQCPYCFEQISMLLEAFYSDQKYIEDCEVCCRPIEIEYTALDGEVRHFLANRID